MTDVFNMQSWPVCSAHQYLTDALNIKLGHMKNSDAPLFQVLKPTPLDKVAKFEHNNP